LFCKWMLKKLLLILLAVIWFDGNGMVVVVHFLMFNALFNHAGDLQSFVIFVSCALIHLTLDQQDLEENGCMMKICYVNLLFYFNGVFNQ